MTKTLIQIQQDAVDAILATPEQGKRAADFGHSCLNRNWRVLRGIRHRYEKSAGRLGFSANQVAEQWNDIKDMAKLEARAEQWRLYTANKFCLGAFGSPALVRQWCDDNGYRCRQG